eukprot:9823869-Karenia_brevis.AAC.1
MKIFRQTWNDIKNAKDASGREKYTIPAPLDMTSRGGVWGDAQPSQPSPTSPAEADTEMGGGDQRVAHSASPEPELTSRPTATPTMLNQPSPTT